MTLETVDSYLNTLTETQKQQLVRTIEQRSLENKLDKHLILLREGLRARGYFENSQPQRLPTPMRLFFDFATPFLINEPLKHRLYGRIARQSLTPLWRWISRDVFGVVEREILEEMKKVLMAGGQASSKDVLHLRKVFFDKFLELQQKMKVDEAFRRKYIAQIGSQDLFEDALDLFFLLKYDAEIKVFQSKMAETNFSLKDPSFIRLGTDIKSIDGQSDSRLMAYALILALKSCKSPYHLVSMLDPHSALPMRIEQSSFSPHNVAVKVIFGEFERLYNGILVVLEAQNIEQSTKSLQAFVQHLRMMSLTFKLETAVAFQARQVDFVKKLAFQLESHFSKLPRLIHRFVRPLGTGVEAPQKEEEIQQTKFLLNLVTLLRPYAEELSIKQSLTGLRKDLDLYIDRHLELMFDQVRDAEPHQLAGIVKHFEEALMILECYFEAPYIEALYKRLRILQKQNLEGQKDVLSEDSVVTEKRRLKGAVSTQDTSSGDLAFL